MFLNYGKVQKKRKKKNFKKSKKGLSSELYSVQDPKDKGQKLTIAYKLRLLWEGDKIKWKTERMRRKIGRWNKEEYK